MTETTKKPDMLIFMCDQHCYHFNGFAGHSIVQTPNLDSIAKAGTVMHNSYTSFPLCVPARMSMLTSQLPFKTGIIGNTNSLPEDKATFLHCLAVAGYETVL